MGWLAMQASRCPRLTDGGDRAATQQWFRFFTAPGACVSVRVRLAVPQAPCPAPAAPPLRLRGMRGVSHCRNLCSLLVSVCVVVAGEAHCGMSAGLPFFLPRMDW